MTSGTIATIALIFALAGTLWRMARWLTLSIGPEAGQWPFTRRLWSTLGSAGQSLLSRRSPALAWGLIVDGLLQRRLWQQSRRRWLIHLGLFGAFTMLVALHALDDQISARLFDDYAATRNPFLFARNMLAAGVLVALIAAAWRRRRNPLQRRLRQPADRIILWLMGAILMTGILLEASQIISAPIFDEMVADYAGLEDPDDINALKLLWASHYDVVFAEPPHDSPEAMELGQSLHEDFCAACHSRPRWAFVSHPVAKILTPAAGFLEARRIDQWLWYLHVIVSCLALALLPWTKLFHLLATPLALAIGRTGPAAEQPAPTRPARRALGLDACTHCGLCSRHCSVIPIYHATGNTSVLPSEKIAAVRSAAGNRLAPTDCRLLAVGSQACTLCGRCTRICPSGIDLQDLWQAGTQDMIDRGYETPHGWIRRHTTGQWADIARQKRPPSYRPALTLGLADRPQTFWACVQCTTCTNVCPVVAADDTARRDGLGMTPQQVMNLLRLQQKELALGSPMVWDCVTCYQCQEHCPQGVKVADVLYELRCTAVRQLAPEKPLPPEESESK